MFFIIKKKKDPPDVLVDGKNLDLQYLIIILDSHFKFEKHKK